MRLISLKVERGVKAKLNYDEDSCNDSCNNCGNCRKIKTQKAFLP